MVDLLAAVAALWGMLMGISPLLQIRRMRVRRSSADVSITYLLVLEVGFALWFAYGLTIGNPALFTSNFVSGAVGLVTLTVAWRLRAEA